MKIINYFSKLNRVSLLLVLATSLIVSCEKEDTPKSTLTGILKDSFKFKGISNKFTVDETAKTIKNAVPLNFGTDVKALVPEFKLAHAKAVLKNKDGAVVKSGVTKLDCTKPFKLIAYSESLFTKEYTVTVVVSKFNTAWKQVTADIDDNVDYKNDIFKIAKLGSKYFAFVHKKGAFDFTAGYYFGRSTYVYSSTDLKTWTKVATTGLDNTGYPESHVFVKDGKLHLITGRVKPKPAEMAHFTSSDGVAWTKVTAVKGLIHKYIGRNVNTGKAYNATHIPANFDVAVLGNKIYAVGGQKYNGGFTGKVKDYLFISSDNGVNWTVSNNTSKVPKAYNPAVFVHNNKIYHIGGAYNATYANGTVAPARISSDVHTYSGTGTFTKMASTGLPGLEGASGVSHDGKIYIFGGFTTADDSKEASNKVYVSEDNGATFKEKLTLPAGLKGRGYASLFVDGDAFVYGPGYSKRKLSKGYNIFTSKQVAEKSILSNKK